MRILISLIICTLVVTYLLIPAVSKIRKFLSNTVEKMEKQLEKKEEEKE